MKKSSKSYRTTVGISLLSAVRYETWTTRVLFLELIGRYTPAYANRKIRKITYPAQLTVNAKCQAIRHAYRNGNAPKRTYRSTTATGYYTANMNADTKKL